MTLIFRAALLIAAMIAAVIWWGAKQSHVLAMSLPSAPVGLPLQEVAGANQEVQPAGLQYAGDGWRCSPLVVALGGGLRGQST